MSRYGNQFDHGSGEAKRQLRQRLERQEMGDEAYEKMISHSDDGAFKIFGALYILGFAVIVGVVVWLGG